MDFADIKVKGENIFNKIDNSVISETITINVNRYYTDVDGQIIDKSTAPAGLQVSYPFYLFNTFDSFGAFKICNKVVPPLGTAKYMYSHIVRSDYDFLEFSGNNSVKGKFNIGDIVFIYTDDLDAPNYFVFIVVSCPFQSYASILQNIANKHMNAGEIKYFVDNFNNYQESLFEILHSPGGTYKVNTYQPYSYKNPLLANTEFITLNIPVKMTQYWGWSSYMQYSSELISFNFELKYK